MRKPPSQNPVRPARRRRVWLIVPLVVLLLAAIALTVFFSASASRRVLSFHGIWIDRSLFAYWQARYRYEYLQAYSTEGAMDTDAFWARVKDGETGLTYGEDCENETRRLVLRIVTAAYLFDAAGEALSSSERQQMNAALESILTYRFEGDKKNFDQTAEAFGFSFSDMKRAYLYELKASLYPTRIALSDEQVTAYFAAHYIRVQILHVRRENASFVRENLRGLLESAPDADARLAVFDGKLSDSAYNDNPARDAFPNGYYFAPDSAYYASFGEEFEKVYPGAGETLLTDAAFSLAEVGDYAEVESDGGDDVWFVMRYPLRAEDLSDEDYAKVMFSDLSDDALTAYLPEWLDGYAGDAKWHLTHARAWLPAGRASDLYLFF